MTNPSLHVGHRIVVILLCFCLVPISHYAQTKENLASRAVVALRFSINLNKYSTLRFSPVSKLLAVSREDGTVQIIDIRDGREQATIKLSHRNPRALLWSPDGRSLLINVSKSATIWDARFGQKPLVGLQLQSDYWRAEDLKWSPDGSLILSYYTAAGIRAQTTVQLWDFESGRLRLEAKIKGIEGHAQFSPNGEQLLTSGSEEARLWDVKTGRLLATLKPPDRGIRERSSGEFSPNGRFVVVHNRERGIYLWDCASGLLKTTIALEEFGDDFYSVLGFSPDGKLLAIHRQHLKGFRSITSIELHDGVTGELRSTLTGKNLSERPDEVVWSSDSQILITGGGRKYEGKIWQVTTGLLKATFPMVLTYGRNPLVLDVKNRDSLSMHPKLPVITAHNDKFIRFWNSETGELVQRLENTAGSAWTTDGELFLTFPTNSTVAQVWQVVQ